MNTKLIENMKKKKKKGFTLIELIIVIAILAILAAIAIPKFGAVRQEANISADKANAKNISLGVAKGIAEDRIATPAADTTYAVNALPIVAGRPAGDANISAYVDGVNETTVGHTTGYTANHFQVEISANSDIRVLLDGHEVYPDAGNAFTAR